LKNRLTGINPGTRNFFPSFQDEIFTGQQCGKIKTRFTDRLVFSAEEVTELLVKADCRNFSCWQTLFSFSDEIARTEKPLKGFDRGRIHCNWSGKANLNSFSDEIFYSPSL
jgi:hypothetical protein